MAPPEAVAGWTPRPAPTRAPLAGRRLVLDPFVADRHAEALWRAIDGPAHADLWRFIPFGPFDSAEALGAAFTGANEAGGWVTYVARAPDAEALLGTASLMAIQPAHGSAEVGCVIYAPELKRTAAATELQWLLARHVFDDLGYRRFEWKCDARNTPSQRAASRLGFRFEGLFRQHMVVRGVNRDTAWFSMTDHEWPVLRAAFETWLAPESFDEAGRPRVPLAALREGAS